MFQNLDLDEEMDSVLWEKRVGMIGADLLKIDPTNLLKTLSEII